MITLVDTILGYTEIQSGDLHLTHSPFNIGRRLKELSLAYSRICEKKGLTLLSHDFDDI